MTHWNPDNERRRIFEAEMAEDLKDPDVQEALHITQEEEERARAEQAEDWEWEQRWRSFPFELATMDEVLTPRGWKQRPNRQRYFQN